MRLNDGTDYSYDTRTIVLSTTIAIILSFLLFAQRPKRNRRHDPNEPPLAAYGLPYIGHGIQFLTNFSGLMDAQRKKHTIFTIINFGQRMHFITDYKSIRKIWANGSFDFTDFAFQSEANLSGLETEDELRASGVGSATLAQYAHTMRGEEELNQLAVRFTKALKEAVDENEALHNDEWCKMDPREFCGMIVFFAAGRSLFGKHWLEGVNVREATRQYALFDSDAPAIVAGLPKLLVSKGCRARDYLVKEVLLPVVQKGCDGGHYYISAYLRDLKKAYENVPDGDIKVASRLMGLLFAINTNTINMLFWSLARIHFADVTLRQDLEKEMNKAMETYPNSYFDCKRAMPLMNSVIIEAFRLHGDPNSFRVVEKDCVVSGLAGGRDLAFRKGDSVFLLSTYDQMQDVQGDRDTFNGRRWIKHTSNEELNKSLLPVPPSQVLAPFGGGKHLCPGRFFALLEMHLVVAFCFKHYEFDLENVDALPPKVVELSAPINQPKIPMMVKLRYRGA
jgi:24-hydroxycholesterol 7alpha-hydroxylase